MRWNMRIMLLLTCATFGIGCGKGLTVDLSATPDPANPGQSVTWTVSVRNDTACETTGESIDLPDPLPDNAGAFAIFVGFNQLLEDYPPERLCREFMTTMTACEDEACLQAHFAAAFGTQLAESLSAQAHAAMQAAHEPQEAGTCITLNNDSEGFVGLCAFDPLSPGETDTAMHTDTAPDTGERHAAQFAIALAPALGDDCRPGTEVAEGAWLLAGCYPVTAPEGAPALSPLATGGAALLLLAAGFVALRRRRAS
jgi:hypothetical protein